MADIKEFMFPCDKEPERRRDVLVFLNNGDRVKAHCTLIIMRTEEYLTWYDNKTRKAIPIKNIKGWRYDEIPKR